jgi:predicted nucleic acid-binding protein
VKTWLVDTNVLLDVIGADPTFGQTSSETLAACAETGMLVINPVIYAEVAVFVPAIEELESILSQDLFRREPLPWEGAFLAAQAFGRYKRVGGRKKRTLADFLIGGHAAVASYGLISRDRDYRHYFDVELLDPTTEM